MGFLARSSPPRTANCHFLFTNDCRCYFYQCRIEEAIFIHHNNLRIFKIASFASSAVRSQEHRWCSRIYTLGPVFQCSEWVEMYITRQFSFWHPIDKRVMILFEFVRQVALAVPAFKETLLFFVENGSVLCRPRGTIIVAFCCVPLLQCQPFCRCLESCGLFYR